MDKYINAFCHSPLSTRTHHTHTHLSSHFDFKQQNQLPEALKKMERVVTVAEERGGDDVKWCFKGLECIVTLLFKLGEYE